jgi:hypothetical protein
MITTPVLRRMRPARLAAAAARFTLAQHGAASPTGRPGARLHARLPSGHRVDVDVGGPG